MSLSSAPGRPWRGLRSMCTGAAVAMAAGLGALAPASVALGAPAPSAITQAGAIANVTRVSGTSRIATAVAISQDQFAATASAKAVVLARSDTFPDALAGGPLAAKVGGPLLLTPPDSLDPAVSAEIQRVAPKGATVYVLGSAAAINTSVDTALAGLGYVPQRISGKDRFATAVAIADQMGDPTTVFEATGLNFPDALAGGPAAIKTGGAILLTKGSAQADATAAYLAAHPGGTHYALGGPAAAADPSATPLAGNDRYWTAWEVARTFFTTPTTIGAATGTNFPDALAAGPDLAAKGAPLLLVPGSGSLPESVTVTLLGDSRTLAGAVVFGGTASVGDDVATQIGVLAGATARAAADDTSAAWTGQYGVLSVKVDIGGPVLNGTDVVDASSGDTTSYLEGMGSSTTAADYVPRAQLAALPLDPDSLESAVNALFAQYDADSGFTSTDPQTLFTLNADQILLDPVAPMSVRYATYAALASDDSVTVVVPGAKDSMGRVGIEIDAPLSVSDTGESKLSFIFDPNTLLPLEETTLDETGKVDTRIDVLSMTTAATAPADPYSS